MARPRSPVPKDRIHIKLNGILLKRLRDDAQAQHRCVSAKIEMLLEQCLSIGFQTTQKNPSPTASSSIMNRG